MKNFVLTFRWMVVCLALALVSVSCDKLKEFTSVDLTLQSYGHNFTIPMQGAGAQATVTFDAYLNVDSLLKERDNDLKVSNIKTVMLKSCRLDVQAVSTNHFGSLSDCKVELLSVAGNNWVTIAQLSSNPDAFATTLQVTVKEGVELKAFLQSGNTFHYRITGTTRRAITAVLTGSASLQFVVNVEIL